jgi:RNA polymerase sigma factor (sigma-70 family)
VDYGIEPKYQQNLLTREEETELANRSRKGDMESRTYLVLYNQRLVAGYVEDKFGFLDDEVKLDLYQVGCMGLMRATQTFDTSKDCKFSTHATWWIKQHINRDIQNNSKNIRIPAYLQEHQSKLRKINDFYIAGLGRKPTLDEICSETGWEIGTALKVMKAKFSETFSISEFLDQYSNGDNDLDGNILLEKVNSVLDSFDHRSRMIIQRRYGINGYDEETLEKIGESFDCTRERVRQLQKEALNRFRKEFGLPPLGTGYANRKKILKVKCTRKKRKSSNGSRDNKSVA